MTDLSTMPQADPSRVFQVGDACFMRVFSPGTVDPFWMGEVAAVNDTGQITGLITIGKSALVCGFLTVHHLPEGKVGPYFKGFSMYTIYPDSPSVRDLIQHALRERRKQQGLQDRLAAYERAFSLMQTKPLPEKEEPAE